MYILLLFYGIILLRWVFSVCPRSFWNSLSSTCASKVLGSANIQCCYVGIWASFFLSPLSDISVEHISLEDPCPLSIFFSSLATFPGLRWHLRELDLLSCLPPTGMLQPRPPLTALFGFVSADSGPRRETSSDGRVGGRATHAFIHPSPWRDSIPSQGHGCQDRELSRRWKCLRKCHVWGGDRWLSS